MDQGALDTVEERREFPRIPIGEHMPRAREERDQHRRREERQGRRRLRREQVHEPPEPGQRSGVSTEQGVIRREGGHYVCHDGN
jgi:hypothetical protein